jgi:hypothetical protein
MPGFIDELVPVEEESVERILAKLMEPGGIALKTDYPKPVVVVKLSIFGDWLKQEGMDDSAALVHNFVKYYSEDMVSNKRKGRAEIVKALSDRMREDERSRWTGRPKDGLEP